MGEANIRYARGEKEDAILMCMEIIRQGAKNNPFALPEQRLAVTLKSK